MDKGSLSTLVAIYLDDGRVIKGIFDFMLYPTKKDVKTKVKQMLDNPNDDGYVEFACYDFGELRPDGTVIGVHRFRPEEVENIDYI